MTGLARFRIAVVAPFPHSHLPCEGWMTRILNIDRLFDGIPRIYLGFSEDHDDSICEETWHDGERAEVLLNPSGRRSMEFVSALAETVDAFYVHTAHLAEYILPWLGTGKVFVDVHGLAPEEEDLSGNAHLRERYETIERWILQSARCCIFVSEAMADHYAGKYPSLEPKWLTIPVNAFLPSGVGITRDPPTDDRRPVVLYSGGIQEWQNLDAMLELAESAGDEAEFRFLSHEHGLIRRRSEELELAHPPAVGHCDKAELPDAYRGADFGLILRDDSPVNRVSCPTKLVEYLLFGQVPIVRSPHLGDFHRLGYAYVTEEEFKGGLMPDAASRDWMIEQNLRVVEKLRARFDEGASELLALMSAPAPREGVATRHFHDLRHFRRSVLARHAAFWR